MRIQTSLATCAVLVLAMPALAGAQDGGQSTQQRDQGQQQEQGQEQQVQGMQKVHVSGKVLAAKHVQVAGQPQSERRRVVLIETDEGNRAIVDLGPEKKQIQVQPTQRIQATGYMGKVSDHTVVFAQQLWSNGSTIDIQRPSQDIQRLAQIARQRQKMQAGQAGSIPVGRMTNSRGELLQSKDVAIQGSNDKNKVVLLRTADGTSFLVDLGPSKDLDDVELKRGTTVAARGIMAPVGNRWVLMAHNAEVGDKKIEVRERKKSQNKEKKQMRGQKPRQK